MPPPSWQPDFDDLVRSIDGMPIMRPDQGRRIWEHFFAFETQDALDIGTCYGTSAAYMAGALRVLGRGRVVTVDSNLFDDQSPAKDMAQDLLQRCGLSDWVEVVRMPHSSYAWWMLEEVERHTNTSGGTPAYDFVYVDGAKSLTIDTTAAMLAITLLRSGGWLLMDDLNWRNLGHDEFLPTTVLANGQRYPLSQAEIEQPHIRAVFDHVLRHHPALGEFRLDVDDEWAWARKIDRPVKHIRQTVQIDPSVPLRVLLRATARRGLKQLRRG